MVICVAEQTCFVVAISSKFDLSNLAESEIKLPHANPGSGISTTSLNQPCVAKCDWIFEVDHSSCTIKGSIPSKLVAAIIDRIHRLKP